MEETSLMECSSGDDDHVESTCSVLVQDSKGLQEIIGVGVAPDNVNEIDDKCLTTEEVVAVEVTTDILRISSGESSSSDSTSSSLPPLVQKTASSERSSSSCGSGHSGNATTLVEEQRQEVIEEEESKTGNEEGDLDDFSFQFKLDLNINGDKKRQEETQIKNQNVSEAVEVVPDNDEDYDDEDHGQVQWDFSLKKLNETGPEYKTIWVSDKNFIKTLTKMDTYGGCDHEPIRITCPCEKEQKFSICFKCHLVFCSAKCARINKTKPKDSQESKSLEGSGENKLEAKSASTVSSKGTKKSSDIGSSSTGTSVEVNLGSRSIHEEEDEKAYETIDAEDSPGKADPDVNAESKNTHASEQTKSQTDVKENVSPKSPSAAPDNKKGQELSDEALKKVPLKGKDRNQAEKSVEKRQQDEGNAAVKSGVQYQPNKSRFNNSQGRGILPLPDVFAEMWPGRPRMHRMPGPWGPPPPMIPLAIMNGNMGFRFGPPQPGNNYNRLRQPGLYDPRPMQFDHNNRYEGIVERNPRNTHLDGQGFRGSRRGAEIGSTSCNNDNIENLSSSIFIPPNSAGDDGFRGARRGGVELKSSSKNNENIEDVSSSTNVPPNYSGDDGFRGARRGSGVKSSSKNNENGQVTTNIPLNYNGDEGFRGARRGGVEFESSSKNNENIRSSKNPRKSAGDKEVTDDGDEDLRFHERHTHNESNSDSWRSGSDQNQASPSKRDDGRKNYQANKFPSSNSPPFGRNQREGNQRKSREFDKRRPGGDESIQRPTTHSKPSMYIESKGDNLSKMYHSGTAQHSDNWRSSSSGSFSQIASSSLTNSSPRSGFSTQEEKPGKIKHPDLQYSSSSSDSFTSPESRKPKSGNINEKVKKYWSTKKISQQRTFLKNLPIMVGHSYGNNIYDFFAFDTQGGLDRIKIEKAISLNEKFTPLTSFLRDSYCLAKYAEDGCWYRARILERLTGDTARVFFIDYGNLQDVDLNSVCEIPEELQDFYPSVINISNLDFIAKRGRDPELVLAKYFEEYLNNEWFRVIIIKEDTLMATTGYPMFKVKLEIKIANLWINFGALLEREGVGGLCLKDSKLNPELRFKSSEQVVLDKSTELPIVISNVTSLNDFDAIKVQDVETRDKISRALAASEEKPEYPMERWAETEFLCAAKRNGKKWARAKILMIAKEVNTVEVKFVDFGDTASVNTRTLKMLPPEMLEIPQLAFKCSLPVFPTEDTWDQEWIDLFKSVADAGLGGKTAIYLYSKEVDPHVIYIVEVFTGKVKDGLAKTVLQRCPDEYDCAYEVNLDVRHHLRF